MKKIIDSKVLRDQAFELGLSSYQLAAASKLPQQVIYDILTGQRQPSAERLAALCKVLDLEPSECYTGEANRI